MVGSEQGTVYKGKQGIQYATVLDSTKAVDVLAQAMRAGQMAKQKDRESAAKQTLDFKPEEVWHYYSAEATQRFENWARKGAGVMTAKNIPNLWTSTDPEAVEWQLEGARLKAGHNNINQAKNQWDKSMEDIRTRGDKYDGGYLQEVEYFPALNSYDAIASGQFNWPQAKFENPSQIFSRLLTQDAKAFETQLNGVPPTENQIIERVGVYFMAPEHKEDFLALRQMYNTLLPESQDRLKAQAELMGMDNAPEMALAIESYKSRFVKEPGNTLNDAMQYAENAPTQKYGTSTKDTAGVTKGSKGESLKNKEYPRQAAISHFNENPWRLDDANYMATLGISMKIPREQRYEKAVDAFAKMVKDNISTAHQSFLDRDGQGLGVEEVSTNFDNWYNDLIASDRTLSTQAANWLFGTKMDAGIVQNSFAVDLPSSALGLRGAAAPVKALAVDFKTEKEALQAQKDLMDVMDKYDTSKMNAEEKAEFVALQRGLKAASTGRRVYYPIIAERIQILKEVHRTSAKEKKSLYEKGYIDDVNAPYSTPNVPWSGQQSPTPAQPGILNTPGQ